MVKNIILSLIVIAVVVGGGYYLFSSNTTKPAPDKVTDNFAFGTTTDQTASVIDSIQATTTATITNKTSNMITIETNYGKIVFETYNSDAPKTVENFVTLANKGFYNGLTFHRVIPGFMIQGGDPNGTGSGGPGYQFADELNPATASYKAGYKKGVVAMANSGSNTNGSQFFIMTADYSLSNDYTIFGKVVSGQDVVDKIASVKTGAGDKPVSPVTMTKVTAQ